VEGGGGVWPYWDFKAYVWELPDPPPVVAFRSSRLKPSGAHAEPQLGTRVPSTCAMFAQELAALLQGLSRLGYQPDERFAAAVLDQVGLGLGLAG
jgi:hypothetical protein